MKLGERAVENIVQLSSVSTVMGIRLDKTPESLVSDHVEVSDRRKSSLDISRVPQLMPQLLDTLEVTSSEKLRHDSCNDNTMPYLASRHC
jgi:hypothetical protein